LLLRRIVMARRGGLYDVAGAVVVACRVCMIAIRSDARGMATQRLAVMASTQRDAILPHIAGCAVADGPLGDDARCVMPGRALDQLDVMRFLRRGFLRHMDGAAAEHRAARRCCHQLHHCRANRHCPVLSFLWPDNAAGVTVALPFALYIAETQMRRVRTTPLTVKPGSNTSQNRARPVPCARVSRNGTESKLTVSTKRG
jgi:hypothetical protein